MKKIAIVAGGDSSEYIVSLKSAQGLVDFIDHEKYQTWVIILHGKQWMACPKGIEDPLRVNIDKNDFSFVWENQSIHFDFAWICIHGTPGENGILQGYFDLIGLPYSCCGVMAAAITFNKYVCNHYLNRFGIKTAQSVLLKKGLPIDEQAILDSVGLPCFVKSNIGGSSFGITKVKKSEDLGPAIDLAFQEGSEVIIESFLAGTEVTNGCYKTTKQTVLLPVTEVVSKNEFFDYEAKYTAGRVEEITPARIPAETTRRIQQLSSKIYDLIGCKGIIRVDYIICPDGVYLLEVNTTPGTTATSFIPQQVKASGRNMAEVMDEIITDVLESDGKF